VEERESSNFLSGGVFLDGIGESQRLLKRGRWKQRRSACSSLHGTRFGRRSLLRRRILRHVVLPHEPVHLTLARYSAAIPQASRNARASLSGADENGVTKTMSGTEKRLSCINVPEIDS